MYQKAYAEDPDNWQAITPGEALDRIGAWYVNPLAVLQEMRDGLTIRTPWAFYRFVDAVEPVREWTAEEILRREG